MKATVKVLVIVMGVFASLNFRLIARAQAAMTAAEYDALVQALEATTPLPASNAPVVGNFYTVQHGEAWPPLPGDTMNLPYWDLGGGFFILDDTNVDYSALYAESASAGRFRLDDSFESDFSPMVYTTNDLWLQILGVTNGTSSLVIHPPTSVTNGVFDLLYATNLVQPISWNWLLRTDPGQTNLAVPGATNAQGFYRLGPPNDLVANDSLGTNFWLAFSDLDSPYGSNILSLNISSPFTTSGTVTIPNQSNGPSLLVTGVDDDPTVNGTYMLTNMAVNPGDYYDQGFPLHGASVTNAYVKGSLLIFFDEDYNDTMGWVLADSGTKSVLYYGFYETYNFNDVVWQIGNDGTPGVPATSCSMYPYIQSFSVTPSNVASVRIPIYAMIGANDAIGTNTGINVSAAKPVSVYAVDSYSALSAAFTVLPMPLLGTNYCVMARPSNFQMSTFRSELVIVATANSTTVWIAPSATADLAGHSGTNIYTITLEDGQTYHVESNGYLDDVTGSTVESDNPIAVFAGASDAFVPDAGTNADNPLVQEQIPVNEWGTQALALSFAGRSGGDSYRVLAANDSTVVYTNGVVAGTNQAGIPLDLIIDGPVEFSANKPMQVAHFGNGAYFDHPDTQEGDPCEILLPSTGHYLETNIVLSLGTNKGDFDENYVNVIVPQSAIANTLFDTTNIPATNFVKIGAHGYFGARVRVTNASATHVITSSQPVGVEVYGWGFDDAYGSFGGVVK